MHETQQSEQQTQEGENIISNKSPSVEIQCFVASIFCTAECAKLHLVTFSYPESHIGNK